MTEDSLTTSSCHGLAIVRWLSETLGSEREETRFLIDSLSRIFNVQEDSLDDFLQFGYSESLNLILAAGIRKKNAGLYDGDLLDAKQHEKYDKFMKYFPSNAYFAGATEGSLERLRRDSRVLAKFRESYPHGYKESAQIDYIGKEIKWPWNIGNNQPASLTRCFCSSGLKENCPICQLNSSQSNVVERKIEAEKDRKKKIALEKEQTKKMIEESEIVMKASALKAKEEEEEILAAEKIKQEISVEVEKEPDVTTKSDINVNAPDEKKGKKKKNKKKT